MKKIIFFIFLIFACKTIEEQTIGYDEIVEGAWDLFEAGDYSEARIEFNNALTYDILDNVSEAYIGLGWSNLYHANLSTELQNTQQRNMERDLAFNNFITAEITNFENINDGNDEINQSVENILTAGLLFVYDYRLFKYNHLYFNCDEIYCGDDEEIEDSDEGFCECGYNGNGTTIITDPEQFRYLEIIPTAKKLLKKTNKLIRDDPDFIFTYDPTINMDDVYFIRANLAFQFDDFSSQEFNDSTLVGEVYSRNVALCSINEFTEECLALGIEEYCAPSLPNIPVEDFLACLSSFHTPVNGVGNE